MISLDDFPEANKKVSLDDLKCNKAKELAELLDSKTLDYVLLNECRVVIEEPKPEIVIFTIEVERSQKIVHDIRPVETIEVLFDPADKCAPEVFALREDFPKVPHTNLRRFDKPISLCLYEQPYSEVKYYWTAARFVKQLQRWLSETSSGQLHGDDQPLEPLFEESKIKLVLPRGLIENPDSTEVFQLHGVEVDGGYTLIAENDYRGRNQEIEFLATIIKCNPVEHGIINRRPIFFKGLHDFVSSIGLDLLSILRETLNKWLEEKKISNLLDKRLLLIVLFPKTRTSGSSIEATDIYSFLCRDPISKIAEEIGAWQMINGIRGGIIGFRNDGANLRIDLCTTMFSFSKKMAAKLNNSSSTDENTICLIGTGALGSQIFMNLIRSGFGVWNLIDEDIFLPHNLARHFLLRFDVGYPKAQKLARHANYMLGEDIVQEVVVDDIVGSTDNREKINSILTSSHAILDCSASIAVSKYLAKEVITDARIISCFLNPAGHDLVILGEDKNKEYSIDIIEIQYYRSILINKDLTNHLAVGEERMRYSNSCRDISSTVPQDYFAMHAAIASKFIKDNILNEKPFASIWHFDESRCIVDRYVITLEKVLKVVIGAWTLYLDDYFKEKVRKFRKERLPNETGGILIGSFDLKNKIIYVLDSVLSPSDSKEWPRTYVRGCKGLAEAVSLIEKLTLNNLEYIGEWHSHPDDSDCSPSDDDRTAFSWLMDLMHIEGLPAIMLIVGEEKVSFYIENM
jgi:hypothetical protein